MDLELSRIKSQAWIKQIEWHQAIASTNDRAQELAAAENASLPLLVLVEIQTAGRGRGGHRWWTGGDSLAFSLALPAEMIPAAPGRPSLVSLAAAVAVVEAVRCIHLDATLGIHWPNDVFVAGKKLAGILVEALSNRRHVIGIGLNVNNSAAEAPEELRDALTSLCDLIGRPLDRTQVLLDVLGQIEVALGLLATDATQIARRADAMCLQHGQTLTIESDRTEVTGVCQGISEEGALRLATAKGERQFFTGALRRFVPSSGTDRRLVGERAAREGSSAQHRDQPSP